MEITIDRLQDNGHSTIGVMKIDGVFEAFTLEDTYHAIKVPGETRIPAGKYDIKLRTEGGLHNKYKAKFGSMHKGMLWLQNVPGFEWVYIHIGNDANYETFYKKLRIDNTKSLFNSKEYIVVTDD